MGGRITALGVHVDYYPCHITALPVAINFNVMQAATLVKSFNTWRSYDGINITID